MSSEYHNEKITVNLRKKGLSDEDDILNSLNQKESIIELDLAENSLTRISEDLSMYQNLVYLDISGNPFQNVTYFYLLFINISSIK